MNTTCILLSIAKDFSATPGARYIHEGPYSGEAFLTELLLPKFNEAIEAKCRLIVDLDGAEGFSTSFLEEAFGGLARVLYSSAKVLEVIDLKCEDEPYLIDEIRAYIKKAND